MAVTLTNVDVASRLMTFDVGGRSVSSSIPPWVDDAGLAAHLAAFALGLEIEEAAWLSGCGEPPQDRALAPVIPEAAPLAEPKDLNMQAAIVDLLTARIDAETERVDVLPEDAVKVAALARLDAITADLAARTVAPVGVADVG